ncbi:hypothetical protein [Staphylococcus hominis]|uniref:hypothetical protein n=1 Tax=Staphylococcus hominis TaxID=1290 RepID=UPI0008A31072|nr:hypothetical protein [Staphylococcus hominis]OFN10521.1 hypothetical protein HMPREF2612_10245 [Staphylococcus sp. HMSC058D09]OFR09086.1 hypothetical protein HMPREF2905_09450 [Staphylococcus sp. HMSC078E07]MCI2919451.1 hypothetical protein [Staphylococcus hominis]MDK7301595.1 hypothetical protein [Staphylococcus hominis]MDS3885845.1 hypothetical protein [Staphylococcus hominis]
MVVENVYVILNSDDELKSIFEEDELNDFFNEYTYDLIEEVEKNYSIEELIRTEIDYEDLIDSVWRFMMIDNIDYKKIKDKYKY